MSSGQPSVANGQSADENHVSSTSGSRVSSCWPHSAHASGVVSATRHVPVGAVPDRELVPPPELARHVPRADRLQPVERDLVVQGGWNVTRPDSIASIAAAAIGFIVAPPLQRDERLDARAGALAVADGVPVALALLEPARAPQPLDDVLAGLLLGQPDELPARRPSCGRRGRSPSARAVRGRVRSRSRSGRVPA